MQKHSNVIIHYASISPYEFKLIEILDEPDENTYEEVVLLVSNNLERTFHDYMMRDSAYSLSNSLSEILKYRIDVYSRTSGTSANAPIIVASIRTAEDFEQFIENCIRHSTWVDKAKFRSSFQTSKVFFRHSKNVHMIKQDLNKPKEKSPTKDSTVKRDLESFKLKSLKSGASTDKSANPSVDTEQPLSHDMDLHHQYEADNAQSSQTAAVVFAFEVDEKELSLKGAVCNENHLENIHKAVNPSHYRSHMKIGDIEYQWTEGIQYRGAWKNPEVFLGALMMQADKYLSRIGGKDHEVQEIMKAVWYLRFAAAYIANDNKPIRIADIPKLLGEV